MRLSRRTPLSFISGRRDHLFSSDCFASIFPVNAGLTSQQTLYTKKLLRSSMRGVQQEGGQNRRLGPNEEEEEHGTKRGTRDSLACRAAARHAEREGEGGRGKREGGRAGGQIVTNMPDVEREVRGGGGTVRRRLQGRAE